MIPSNLSANMPELGEGFQGKLNALRLLRQRKKGRVRRKVRKRLRRMHPLHSRATAGSNALARRHSGGLPAPEGRGRRDATARFRFEGKRLGTQHMYLGTQQSTAPSSQCLPRPTSVSAPLPFEPRIWCDAVRATRRVRGRNTEIARAPLVSERFLVAQNGRRREKTAEHARARTESSMPRRSLQQLRLPRQHTAPHECGEALRVGVGRYRRYRRGASIADSLRNRLRTLPRVIDL